MMLIGAEGDCALEKLTHQLHQNISNINLIYFIEMNNTDTLKGSDSSQGRSDSSVGTLQQEYLNSLDDKEMIAYNIAKGHLGTLFTLEKSNHYLEWLQTRK
jgi:hypothetical protein